MKCPLLLIGRTVLPQDKGKAIADCLKEECAWWDLTHNCCVVKSLGFRLAPIGTVLIDIRDKMPHLEQFKRP